MCRFRRSCDIILVKVVALEELLDAISAQLLLTLLDGLRVLPLLVVHVILIEIVHIDVWYVLRLHAPISQRLPIKVIKPWVRLELLCAPIVANSVHRFTL